MSTIDDIMGIVDSMLSKAVDIARGPGDTSKEAEAHRATLCNDVEALRANLRSAVEAMAVRKDAPAPPSNEDRYIEWEMAGRPFPAPLYSPAPVRKWERLTDEELSDYADDPTTPASLSMLRWVQEALIRKNGGE